MQFEGAKRLDDLPPYLFSELEQMKLEHEAQGNQVIDLSVGDPNFPTSPEIVNVLNQAAVSEEHQHYPPFRGYRHLRVAIAEWYKRRFDIEVNPDTEVLILLGSKEGLSHISLAFLDPGDCALVPNPGYPAYLGGIALAGGKHVEMPLLEENKFLIDVDRIDPLVAERAKLLFMNYPNNPTGEVADLDAFTRIVDFAKQHNIVVVHDAAYSEVTFGDYESPSFLQAKGAKDVGVEFHSFSKTFCMTGWRIGMVVGNEEVINRLAKVKAFVDSGVFGAIQEAAAYAIGTYETIKSEMKSAYEKRIRILCDGLAAYGWRLTPPKAGYFIWGKVPEGWSSMDFCKKVLEEANVMLTPGSGFGKYGEGYVRISLNVNDDQLTACIQAIGSVYQVCMDNNPNGKVGMNR
ncbi:LL-diaminopimelate aminotransferase [Paenibacillus sp. FSL H8-0537]|uniref:LL-diaminopimelate aminotransferase n=1 Tax=Paenibacillus sp. FSL H8-0537 TaxID=2921399 RepID=UPI0031019F5E